MENLVGKKRNAVNQSLFSRNLEGGVVGLGIVAAMTDSLSRPIPIIKSGAGAGAGRMDELSESYTCVISHIGNSSVKRVLVDDCSLVAAMFSASPLNVGGEVRTELEAGDFLSCCYLCNKQLHGLDIFMYRGEKAFCSSDCRDKHIRSDKRKEKCRSEAVEYSVSPCSSPMLFSAGVAAA